MAVLRLAVFDTMVILVLLALGLVILIFEFFCFFVLLEVAVPLTLTVLVPTIDSTCGVFSVLYTLLEPSCVSEVFVVTLVTPVLERLPGVQVSLTLVVIVILGDLTCGTFETEMLGDEVVLHTVEVRLTLASFSLIFGISLSFLPLSQVLV